MGEKKDLKSKTEELDLSQRMLQSTLGPEWVLDVDLASFAKCMAPNTTHRQQVGRHIVSEKVLKCMKNDISQMEGD